MNALAHLSHATNTPIIRHLGGFFIADDYSCVGAAKLAVDQFREWHGMRTEESPLILVGNCTAYWRASAQLRAEDLRLDM